MSWVISRRLNKSGGNNIYWRIGNFNRFSSKACRKWNKISNGYTASKQYLRFKRTNNGDLHKAIDEYISARLLYNYSRGEAAALIWTRTWHANTLTKFRGARDMYYKIWGDIYARYVTNKIFGKCRRRLALIQRFNCSEAISDKEFKDLISNKALTIIIRSKRYDYMSTILKEGGSHSLVKYSIDDAMDRWRKWRSWEGTISP